MFDLNKDGVANYGMYADWLAELRVLAGRPILTDMFHGAEAYLEMWERADGVPAMHCLSPAQARRIRLREGYESVLFAAGQPLSRPGRSYQYCLAGGRRLSVTFSRGGRVQRLTRHRA